MITTSDALAGATYPISAPLNYAGIGQGKTGSNNQWNDSSKGQVDPLIQFIMSTRGAPHGKNPGAWFDSGQINQSIQDYINTLSPDQQINYINNINPQKLSQDFQTIYGRGFDFNSSPLNQLKGISNTFKSIFGRDLTSSELAQVYPAFQGPNGQINGNAFLANLKQQYKSNPTLDPGSAVNQLKPGDISNQVNQQFQSILGRAPTADELSHFTQAIQSNQTDAYGLGNFLKQQPEYTNAQDTQFRSGLNTELQNYDVNEFNREKGGIMSDYAARGMSPGASPSLDYALTDLMGKIASNRSAYLASLSASQYGGNKNLAVGNYQNTLDQMYNQNQQNQQTQRGYSQQLLNQGFQGADYQTQMRDYMNFLNSQPKQKGPNTFDYLNAGLQLGNSAANLVGGYNRSGMF